MGPGLTLRRNIQQLKRRWQSEFHFGSGVWSATRLHIVCLLCSASPPSRSTGKVVRSKTSHKTAGPGQQYRIRTGSCLPHTASTPHACQRPFKTARWTPEKQRTKGQMETDIKICTAGPIGMLKNFIKALHHVLPVYQLRIKHAWRS